MPATAETPGLRERRRRETTTQIHEAAVAGAEADGLAATTVARIAERAGISSRTFFRYFASKEEAILPGQGFLREALLELQASAADSGLSPREAAARVVAVMDRLIIEDPIDPLEHRRIGALLEVESALRAHVANEDDELVRLLTRVLLVLSPAMDLDDARLCAEVIMSAWRLAWWAWDRDGVTECFPTPYSRWRDAVLRLGRAVALLEAEASPSGS